MEGKDEGGMMKAETGFAASAEFSRIAPWQLFFHPSDFIIYPSKEKGPERQPRSDPSASKTSLRSRN
jgi:hypothetical protein